MGRRTGRRDMGGGEVPFGAEGEFNLDIFSIQSAPMLTTEDNGASVRVETTFSVRREAFSGEIPSAIGEGLEVRFRPGGELVDGGDSSYGLTSLECEREHLDANQETMCLAAFTPEDPAQITNFFWTIDDVRFGAWPSQGDVTEGKEWVVVAELRGKPGIYTTDPFAVDGHVRARYLFDFDPGGYIFGNLQLRETVDGECGGAPLDHRRRMEGSAEGVEEFGYVRGDVCGSFHHPAGQLDSGSISILFEELQ